MKTNVMPLLAAPLNGMDAVVLVDFLTALAGNDPDARRQVEGAVTLLQELPANNRTLAAFAEQLPPGPGRASLQRWLSSSFGELFIKADS